MILWIINTGDSQSMNHIKSRGMELRAKIKDILAQIFKIQIYKMQEANSSLIRSYRTRKSKNYSTTSKTLAKCRHM